MYVAHRLLHKELLHLIQYVAKYKNVTENIAKVSNDAMGTKSKESISIKSSPRAYKLKNLEDTKDLKKIFTKTSSTKLAMPWLTTCPLIISLTSKEIIEWD